jgi:hypothetical protein
MPIAEVGVSHDIEDYIRLTSFQCAARGPHAAPATRRTRCRDRWGLLKERVAAGVTPLRQRCERRGSAGLGTAACQHHWRVRRPGR